MLLDRSSAAPRGHDLRRLSVESRTHPDSIRRLYTGRPVQPLTRIRVEEACARLGVPRPPPEHTGGQP